MSSIQGKTAVIKHINSVGIKNIECTTVVENGEGYIAFCITITTKDSNSFHFTQTVNHKFVPEATEVIYFDETGNGQTVAELEKGFKPKKVKNV